MCPTSEALREGWRSCTRHDGYEVHFDGRVRNRRTGHVLKPQQAKSGRYFKVHLGHSLQVQLHQLVCEAWQGPRPAGMPQVVDHVDNDGSRNCATNLRWSSYSMNTRNYYAWQARLQREAEAAGADQLEPLTAVERADYERRWGAEALDDYERRAALQAHRSMRGAA